MPFAVCLGSDVEHGDVTYTPSHESGLQTVYTRSQAILSGFLELHRLPLRFLGLTFTPISTRGSFSSLGSSDTKLQMACTDGNPKHRTIARGIGVSTTAIEIQHSRSLQYEVIMFVIALTISPVLLRPTTIACDAHFYLSIAAGTECSGNHLK